jgi:hypothetical protein
MPHRMIIPTELNGFRVKAWYTKQEWMGNGYLPHGVALITRDPELHHDPYVVWDCAYNEASNHTCYRGFYTQNFEEAWEEFTRRCNVT